MSYPFFDRGGTVGAYQCFDRLANALPHKRRQLRLPLPAVLDRRNQGRWLILVRTRQHRWLQKGSQGLQLGTGLTLLEPELRVPLARCFEVKAGIQQPPLPSVCHQGKRPMRFAQPLGAVADGLAPASLAQHGGVVEEDGQWSAPVPGPHVSRLQAFTGHEGLLPGLRHGGTTGPDPLTALEPAQLVQHPGDEAACVHIA